MSFLDLEPIRRVRQNHALEHATVHMLTRHDPNLRLVGRSTSRGFIIYGDVDTELLASAASEALSRLQAGERSLAVHPRCGTGIATAGILSGLTAFAVMQMHRRRKLEVLPTLLMSTTLAVMASQPLSLVIQREYTTDAHVENVRIAGIRRREVEQTVIHHVDLEHD